LHVAFQFDKPYLLDESGTTVSAIIGKLTHANTLRLAVKEGNRRSLESSRLLKTRLTDLEKAREQLVEYRWVDQSTTEVAEAKELLTSFKSLTNKVATVDVARTTTKASQQKYLQASQNVSDHPDVSAELEKATDLLQRSVKAYSVLTMIEDKKFFAKKLLDKKPVTVDSAELDVIDSYYDKIAAVKKLVSDTKTTLSKFQALKTQINTLKEASEDAQEVYNLTLRRANYCPTCGNSVCS